MKRKRITITLKKEILEVLDKKVDGELIRNRSHAVENILSKILLKKPAKALILAGGKEFCLPQLGRDMPKALLPVHGRPVLEHTILQLKSIGIEEIIISIKQGGQKIRDYFRNGSRFGVDISYLEQEQSNKGTAQPLVQAQARLMDNIFLLIYGDVLAKINYLDFLEFHENQKNLIATMALASVDKASMWGLARLMGSKIVEFQEKPKTPFTQSHLVNAGVYVMSPKIFEYLTADMVKLESELFPRLAEENRLGGYSFGGSWCDVSSAQAYVQALRDWKN